MPSSIKSGLSREGKATPHRGGHTPASERGSAHRHPSNPQLRPQTDRHEAASSVASTDSWGASSTTADGLYTPPPQPARLTHAALASIPPDGRPLETKVDAWLTDAASLQGAPLGAAQGRAVLAATKGLPLSEIHVVALARALDVTLQFHEPAGRVPTERSMPLSLRPLAAVGEGQKSAHILARGEHFDGLGDINVLADGGLMGALLPTRAGPDNLLMATAEAAALPMVRQVNGMVASGQLAVMRRHDARLRAIVPDIDVLSDHGVAKSFAGHVAQQLRHQVASELRKPEYGALAEQLEVQNK